MAGAGLGFSYTGGGRETLSGVVGRRDSLVPGPTGQKSPCTLPGFSVERGSGSRLVEHPPEGLSPGMTGTQAAHAATSAPAWWDTGWDTAVASRGGERGPLFI